jgi:hypothetical protein
MAEPSILKDSDFEKLLLNPEGFLIDYKRDQYLLDDNDNKADCIKDIISLANTIRQTSAFIVMGIEEIDGKRSKYKHRSKSLSYEYGITRIIDDQVFQSLVKDKVNPKPYFLYYTHTDKDGNKFGIIEIFIRKGVDPFRPIKDFGGRRKNIKFGTLYYRLGSTNEPASGDKDAEDRIFIWFHEIENQHWDELLLACHNFDAKGRLFILITPPELNTAQEQLSLLAKVDWSLIIDFNPNTESDGVVAAVRDKLSLRRSIHSVKLGDRQTFAPESATYCFAARGLSGFQKTLVDDNWREWNRKYSTYLRQLLIDFYKACSDRPVTVVSLWDDPNYIRTLCESIDNAFEDAANFVFATDNSSSLSSVVEFFGEFFNADIISIRLPQILEGLRKTNPTSQLSIDSQQIWLPSLNGGSAVLSADDFLWIQQDFEIVHLNSGKREEAIEITEHDFYRGMTVSWFDLNLTRDVTRDITSSLIQLVRTDLKSRSATRISLYHEPGAGGTTVARRVAWDIHETYPTVLLHRIRTKGASNRLSSVEETYNRLRLIYDKTEQSILVIVEASKVYLDDITRLYDFVRIESLPVVFLIVQRGFYQHSTSKELRRRYLNSILSENECLRFVEKYAGKFPNKRLELEKIRLNENSKLKTPFYLGLLSYEDNFISLPDYVKTRLEAKEVLEIQKEIVVYLALTYHYSQRCLSSQLFASLLEDKNQKSSKNKTIWLEKRLPRPLLDLLICERSTYWRPIHELIAFEIVEQVLSSGSVERRNWSQNLSTWALKFINLCSQNNRIPSNEVIEVLTHLFVLKDNQELIGKEEIND